MELSVTFNGLSYLSSSLVLTAPTACLWMCLDQRRETSKKTGPTAMCMTYQAVMPLHHRPHPCAWNCSLARRTRLVAIPQGAKESRMECYVSKTRLIYYHDTDCEHTALTLCLFPSPWVSCSFASHFFPLGQQLLDPPVQIGISSRCLRLRWQLRAPAVGVALLQACLDCISTCNTWF